MAFILAFKINLFTYTKIFDLLILVVSTDYLIIDIKSYSILVGYMEKNFFSDVHTYFLVCISTIMALLFNLFGNVGLAIYGLLIVYSFIFFLLNVKKQPLLKTPIFYVMVAYYAYHILAVCINGSVIQLGSSILQLFFLSLIGFFQRDTKTIKHDITSLAKCMTVFGLLMSIGSLLMASFALYFPEHVVILPSYLKKVFESVSFSFYNGRIRGFGNQPNVSSEFCLICSMFSTFLITNSSVSRKWHITSLINIIITVYFIFIAASSRTKMVAIAAFFCCYFVSYFFVINRRNQKYKKIITVLLISTIIVIILLVLILAFSNDFRTFIMEDVIRISSLETASGRDDVYKTAFDLGKGHRLFGYNVETLKKAIAPHAHNIYLQLLSFAGIPGLVLFCIYFFYTAFIAGKNLINNSFAEEEKNLNCFIFCFIFCYFIQGLPEVAGVDIMRLSSVSAQLIFASTHLIYHNKKKFSPLIE